MPISTLGVIGAGTMGGGIAISAALHGYSVTVVDLSEAMLGTFQRRLQTFLDRQLEKGRISSSERSTIEANISVSDDFAAIAGADLVIEAVFEQLDVKRQVFEILEQHVSENCILATNTSALKVADIAAVAKHPGRICGLHYFSPAEVNRAVEFVEAEQTGAWVTDAVQPFLERCRKQVILCRDQPGFAVNRFFCPYLNEAVRLADDGLASPGQIDKIAVQTFGVALGPFAVMNIVKPRIALHAVQNLAELGDVYAPVAGLVAQGEADQNWDIDTAFAPHSEEIFQVVSDRLQGAVYYAVLDALVTDVAAPEAFDLGAQVALTFAAGPVEMMRQLGVDKSAQKMATIVEPVPNPLINALRQLDG